MVGVILNEEVRRKSSRDSSLSGSALNVEGREKSSVKGFRSSRSKSGGKGGVRCFYCKEFGHVKMDFPECANMNKGDSLGVVAVVALQKEKKHEEYLGDALIVSKDMDTIYQDEWILYLGCPIHICFRRKHFDTF